MRQENFPGYRAWGHVEIQCCAEPYRFYSRSRAFQTALRFGVLSITWSSVHGVLSQRKS